MFQNKQFTDHFCCLLMYVKLATVQIWRQSMNEIYLHVPGMLSNTYGSMLEFKQ